MPDIFRIKRRAAGGAAGPPASLAASELAYNEQDDKLYYGKGDNGGQATSIIAIGGAAAGAGGVTQSYVDTQDALRVLKAGDTMTGNLTLSASSAQYILNMPLATDFEALAFYENALSKAIIYYFGSNYSVSAKRNSLEMRTLAGGGPIGFYTNNTERLRVEAAGGLTSLGDLTISKSFPTIYLNNSDATANIIYGRRNSFHRWGLVLGSGSTESGGNAGSDFSLVRYADNGNSIGAVLAADRVTGLLTVVGDPTAALGIATKQYVDNKPSGASISIADTPPASPTPGAMWWESDTGKLWIYYNDGTSSQWVQAAGNSGGGSSGVSQSYVDTQDALRVAKAGDTMSGSLTINNGSITLNNGSFYAVATATTGTYYFGNSATKYLNYDGANFQLAGGGLSIPSGVVYANTKGNQFGDAGGTSSAGAVVPADANIKLYDFGGNNWCGLGCDGNGDFWVRTGLSGTPVPAFKISSNGSATFTGTNVSIGTSPFSSTLAAVSISFPGGITRYGMTFRPAADSTYAMMFNNAAGTGIGSISLGASSTGYNTTSDGRLKEDLRPFDAGPTIDATNVYDFAWKETGERAYGVIAQEAIEVYPQAVTHGEEIDSWAIDYSKYVPMLLQELKDLRARVAALEAKYGV